MNKDFELKNSMQTGNFARALTNVGKVKAPSVSKLSPVPLEEEKPIFSPERHTENR